MGDEQDFDATAAKRRGAFDRISLADFEGSEAPQGLGTFTARSGLGTVAPIVTAGPDVQVQVQVPTEAAQANVAQEVKPTMDGAALIQQTLAKSPPDDHPAAEAATSTAQEVQAARGTPISTGIAPASVYEPVA